MQFSTTWHSNVMREPRNAGDADKRTAVGGRATATWSVHHPPNLMRALRIRFLSQPGTWSPHHINLWGDVVAEPQGTWSPNHPYTFKHLQTDWLWKRKVGLLRARASLAM